MVSWRSQASHLANQSPPSDRSEAPTSNPSLQAEREAGAGWDEGQGCPKGQEVRLGPYRRLSTEELMLLHCGVKEESLREQRDQTSQSYMKSP